MRGNSTAEPVGVAVDEEESQVAHPLRTSPPRLGSADWLAAGQFGPARLARLRLAALEPFWLPGLAFVGALGVLLVALAYSGARTLAPWAGWSELFFWGGLLALFVPIVARLLAPEAPRSERLSLVLIFGMGLYLAKLLRYPLAFAFHDEFLHWRTANDILSGERLFAVNPILPISALYPGLELITSAIAQLGGMSLFSAGALVLGSARLVFVLALFLFYERISRSAQTAGLATLLYLANPKLIIFDAQFSYESLALPLLALVLFALAWRGDMAPAERAGPTLAALLGIAAITVTHHLTAYALTLFLLIWAGAQAWLRLRARVTTEAGAGGMALLSLVLNLTWLVYIATLVVEYLAPHLIGAVSELLKLIGGELARRELFRDYAGQVPPLWEREVALGATGLILVGIPFGLFFVWRYERLRAGAVALAVAALAHPASLAFRLTKGGGEASDRAAGSVFIAVAFVLAVGITRFLLLRRPDWRWQLPFIAALTVIFLGNVVIGVGPQWARMPGPYLVAADARSVEPQGVEAATWARDRLGPGQRFAADRINRLLLASYGEQRAVTHVKDGLDVSPLFFGAGYGTVQNEIVQRAEIDYVLVDQRLSTALPRVGIYFEAPEPNALQHSAPVDPAALAKFDRLLGVDRLFDSGSIVIYRLGEDVREP